MEYSRKIIGERVGNETYGFESWAFVRKIKNVDTFALLLIRRLAIVSTG